MQVKLTGKTVRIEGATNPISTTLRERLAENGALNLPDGVPDLLILSAPLQDASGFDWETLAGSAHTMGMEMKKRGAGRIVFLLSACAALATRRQPELSMRMAGLHAVMRTLAMSLAPEVAVNALGAGAIGDGTGEFCSGDAVMIGHASVGRPGTVEEACNVALFLCDPDTTYLTGQLLSADGGWTAGYGRNF